MSARLLSLIFHLNGLDLDMAVSTLVSSPWKGQRRKGGASSAAAEAKGNGNNLVLVPRPFTSPPDKGSGNESGE